MHVDALTRLALAAGRGDQAALEQLVEGSYDQVWRLCARLVDTQSADDLAQEAYGRAVSALPGFGGRSSARTWLLAITRNTCMDELRARTRHRRRDARLAARPLVGEAAVPDATEHATVADALSRLSPERREAFVLTQLLGLTYAEAAAVCGCPIGTIRSRVARARADLLAAERAAEAGAARPAPSYSAESSMYPMTRDMTS
jgi:RNA polymerase sigma-70 factor (ECF subfamily)